MQIVVISMPQNRDGDQNGANIICATGPSELGSNGAGGQSPPTLAKIDLLCMKNAGTKWTMVSYLKK